MNIVEQLLIGSNELNRKQAEISQVIKILGGWLNRSGLLKHLHKQSFCFGSWVVSAGDMSGPLRSIIFNCALRDVDSLPADKISDVHAELPALVQALVEAFPILTEKWQPLLDAAANVK